MTQSRIRVMHIISGFGVGGTERFLLRLCQYTNKDRFEFIVVGINGDEGLYQDLKATGHEIIVLGLDGISNIAKSVKVLTDLVQQKQPDLVQGWMYHANMLGLLIKRRCKVPVLWNIRTSLKTMPSEQFKTRLLVKASIWFSRYADGIIYNSNAGKLEHEQAGYCESKGVVIQNGIDTQQYRFGPQQREQLRQAMGICEQQIVVGMVARFHPVKDYATFFKALSMTSENVIAVVVGLGLEKENPALDTLLDRYDLNEKVIALGRRSDIPALLCAMDIYCSTSVGEGFSNSLLEAMSIGLPSVVTDVGDAKFMMGDSGFYFEPGDAQRLAQLINELAATSGERREQIGETLRQDCVRRFSIDANMQRYQTYYQQMVGN